LKQTKPETPQLLIMLCVNVTKKNTCSSFD
jgi:hypothetical protein